MIPDGRQVDSTRRLAAGLPAQPTDPYLGLVWLNIWGTLLTLAPLLPFYALVLSLTARQTAWFGLAVLVATTAVVLQDLWMIRRHIAPIRVALAEGGREPWRAALRCALNYPITSVKRTYGPHVWVPMVLFAVLAVALNLALELHVAPWKLAVVFPVSVTVMPLIHAVLEFQRAPKVLRGVREYAEAMLGGSPDPGEGLIRVGIGTKLFIPFLTTVAAPLVIVGVAAAIQTDNAVEEASARAALQAASGAGGDAWAGTWTADARLEGPAGAPAGLAEALAIGTETPELEGWIIRLGPAVDGAVPVVAVRQAPLQGRVWPVIWWILLTAAIWIVISVLLMRSFVHSVKGETAALLRALDRVAAGDLTVPPRISFTDEFGDLAKGIRHMMQGLKEREQLQDLFGRHTSPAVVKLLMAQKELLGGTRQAATILFSDIRNFTRMSDGMEPEALVSVLNRYLDVMVKAILDHRGRVDKFIGDGILAVFGYPMDDPDHVANAVRCTLAMRAGLQRLNTEFVAEGRAPLAFGAGVHTGDVVCGSIGSTDRLEFTVIGDTVNTASRIEGLTKKLGVDVVVSGRVQAATREWFEYEARADEKVKGKTMALEVFALVGPKSGTQPPPAASAPGS